MPKTGIFSTVSHTEFELNPMQNDRVRGDFGSGPRQSGSKVLCHLNFRHPFRNICFHQNFVRHPALHVRTTVPCRLTVILFCF